MTTLTFHVSRSIAAACQPGDEILVTALDHEANVSPWLAAAADHGLTVKTVDFRPDDCTLDLSDLERKLSSKTRLVAAGYASNAVGTLNPISQIAGMAHDVGAWLYVDAVHYAPHLTLDVAASGADFLVSPPTSGSGRTSARCGAAPSFSSRCPNTRFGRRTTISRQARQRSS